VNLELTAGKLAGIYDALAAAAGERRDMDLQEIWLAEDAITSLPAFALAGRPPGPVLLVQDETDIRAAGRSVKPLVKQVFEAAGCDVEVVVIRDDWEVHTTPAHIAEAQAHLKPGQVVVSVGSGTITDIAKHAVFEYEAAHPGERLWLVCLATANSVVAYTSNQAPINYGHVKRTIPSRLPDLLAYDTRTLADAPREYTDGGIGDTYVGCGSFADYRLSHLMGLGRWEPLSWEIMKAPTRRFLGRDPVLQDRSAAGIGQLVLDLSACGFALSVANESGPLSGLEHVTSHMLDMAAAYDGRPVGNHGSQCSLACILTLIAWQKVMAGVDLSALDPDRIDVAAEQAKVFAVFGFLDEDGQSAQECWNDYAAKIGVWQANRAKVLALRDDWDTYRADLAGYLTDPQAYVEALAAVGHPLRFEDIPTGLTEDRVRWAFTHANLMRKRSYLSDLLGFAGQWTEDFVDDVFTTYHRLTAPYLR
jgi:glycerol-1-phosphate dehydrogenase [NAD(P)+]